MRPLQLAGMAHFLKHEEMMADRSAADIWGRTVELVCARCEEPGAILRELWTLQRNFDFTPDQANIDDWALAILWRELPESREAFL